MPGTKIALVACREIPRRGTAATLNPAGFPCHQRPCLFSRGDKGDRVLIAGYCPDKCPVLFDYLSMRQRESPGGIHFFMLHSPRRMVGK